MLTIVACLGFLEMVSRSRGSFLSNSSNVPVPQGLGIWRNHVEIHPLALVVAANLGGYQTG